ncbi:MAG: FKBP-type peptidyl-prolyl cis-trans isomerase N-terminal domain-containing protein [Fidelibacterota bacterium]
MMKKLFLPVIMILLAACGQKTADNQQEPIQLKTHLDSVSYSVGMDMAIRLQAQFKNISPDIMIRGMEDTYQSDSTALLTPEEKEATIRKFREVTLVKEREELAANNQAEAQNFLKENKNKAGVQEHKSGLQYRVVTEGTGEKPTFKDVVKINYIGRFVDSTIFDASDQHGGPATFALADVIPGFSEGIMLMPVGSKYEFFIPPYMAYGSNDGPGGPNKLLIFTIELLEIIKKK